MKNYLKTSIIVFLLGYIVDGLSTYLFFNLRPDVANTQESNCLVGEAVRQSGSWGVITAQFDMLLSGFVLAMLSALMFEKFLSKQFNIKKDQHDKSLALGLTTLGTLKIAAGIINLVGLVLVSL